MRVTPHFVTSTGFKAQWGEEASHVAILCEYDALPEIGHACGHNLIAEVGVGAGVALKAAMENLGRNIGKITVLGTPAEEGGGGKIDMINAGVFDDVDCALMVHPAPCNGVDVDFSCALRRLDD
jgi:metal-dependent amidase/aminoacylase/carboxypeptidase family protein